MENTNRELSNPITAFLSQAQTDYILPKYWHDEVSNLTIWANIPIYMNNTLVPSNTTTDFNSTKIVPMRDNYPEIFLYGCLPMASFGVIANILCLYIFCTKMGSGATAMMFRWLAITDEAIVLYQIIRALDFNFAIVPKTPLNCKLMDIPYFFSRFLAAWLLVLISIERAVGVRLPHRARTLVSKSRMRWAGALLVLASAIMTSPLAFYHGPDPEDAALCVPMQQVTELFSLLDITLSTLLPFLLLITCSVLIIHALWESARLRANSTNQTQTTTVHVRSVSAMLVSVALMHVILRIPFTVFWSVPRLASHLTIQEYIIMRTAVCFCESLNHASNILIYCATGTRFRRALASIIFCRGVTRKQAETSLGTLKSSTATTSMTVSSSIRTTETDCVKTPDAKRRGEFSRETKAKFTEIEHCAHF